MSQAHVRLYQTLEHPCGYYADRHAINLVIDPNARDHASIYDHAIAKGFRRSGGLTYRPNCVGCRACQASRLPVAQFTPDRAQRRVWFANQDLEAHLAPAELKPVHHDLFNRYVATRHRDGGMDSDSPDDLKRFLIGPWAETHFLELWFGEQLVATAVTDMVRDGLSAVYTFYDPELTAKRSLGTFAILKQVELAKRLALSHVYLGYWIAGHPKMRYKTRFKGLELLIDGRWQPAPNA
jgi:leucyl-tRNA---protein transferase